MAERRDLADLVQVLAAGGAASGAAGAAALPVRGIDACAVPAFSGITCALVPMASVLSGRLLPRQPAPLAPAGPWRALAEEVGGRQR